MKIIKIVLLTGMAAALLLAQAKDSKPNTDSKQSKDADKSEAAKAAAAAAADPASVIPKGATQVEPNLYRYTDAQGKTWLYRRFPFGVSKWEDKPVERRAAEVPLSAISRDLGDSVEFQRQTPFGISKWVTKKTDLNDEEKALLAAYETKRGADTSAEKNKDKQEKK